MTERIGILVRNGLVENVIIWADHTPEQLKNEGWEYMAEVTDHQPRPGIGWTWTKKDGCRPPKPYTSWVWNGLGWEAPTPMPTDGGPYQWNEQTQTWDTIPTPTE